MTHQQLHQALQGFVVGLAGGTVAAGLLLAALWWLR